jgi:hypothetical protein
MQHGGSLVLTPREMLGDIVIQAWAFYRLGGDRDLGASVAAQMDEIANRLPAPNVQAAMVRYGFCDVDHGANER